ncbi:cysteine-rich receptor-like protein kinase 14 [Gossypium hirsutum]|uniref:Cysteine-rich receptor-like protein kinase 14 n=1 Tax=Gossypium hirsutum TaxID=3635 RepID=A0A1U8LQG6_GOSHI|nr:cysteine-rich receptor-like protein kinase 14 [Gossypium hirsutum]XP_040971354.1 cysteine-rich receptor-like protein kinase 14 [Gossypium hirsutum]
MAAATKRFTHKCKNNRSRKSRAASKDLNVQQKFPAFNNRSFYGTLEELGNPEAGYNTGDIKSNSTEFDTVWESLMDTVVRNASNGSSTLKYATGEADFTVFQKIYALMQCTPDLSHKDCDSYLRQSVSNYESCCHGKQGGYVTRPSCYFRWDLYPFYTTATPSLSLPSLSPPPSPGSPLPVIKGM